jgi:hypothetical protein
MKNKTTNIKKLIKRCDSLWRSYAPDINTLQVSRDIRMYISGGMWVHPCGKTFQEGGRDGFDKNYGIEYCVCDLCKEIAVELSKL